MINTRALFVACLAVLVLEASTALGQATLSDSSEISLVTILPGDAVYSLFGHSALRVYDPENGIDFSYSYGTFHFDDPMFVPKFALGELDYYLSVARWQNALRLYRDIERRPAIEQKLNLTTTERDALFRFLQTNAMVENRYYRYDFLYDNCSTRIRDALQNVLEGRVDFEHVSGDPRTFRQLLEPYLASTPFLKLGIDLLLGAQTDRVASTSETTFLPDHLEISFDHAQIMDASGSGRPLVAEKDSLIHFRDYELAKTGVPWPGIVFTLFAVLVLLKTILEARRGPDHHVSEMFDVVLFGLVGLVGCFLLFMWFGTAHHVTADNWNLAWAWPTHLLFAALLGRVGITRTTAAYAGVTAISSALAIALWPIIPQDLNETFLAVVIVLAARSAWILLLWKSKRAGTDLRPAPDPFRS